jgi:hypothetical protein
MMLLAAGPVKPKEQASIGGVVVMAETNTPVAHAIVRLTRVPDENPTSTRDSKPFSLNWGHTAKTDHKGRFVFDKMQPGNYRIDVNQTSGFVISTNHPNRCAGLQ